MSKQTTKTPSELPAGTIQAWPKIIAAPAVWESGAAPRRTGAATLRPRHLARRGSSSW